MLEKDSLVEDEALDRSEFSLESVTSRVNDIRWVDEEEAND